MINLMKEIAFFILNDSFKVIYWICKFYKIKQNRIFVNCFDGRGYGDNPKYIVEELKKINNNIEIYWLFNGRISNKRADIIYIKPFSIKAVFYQATSKIWISTVRMPYYSIKREDQIYIHTWHGGLAFKKIEQECDVALSPRYIRTAKHDSTMIDYFISANKDNTEQFKNYFWYRQGKFLEIGSPRNDIFFKNNKEDKKKIFGFEGKKIAVYAPTFRIDEGFSSYNINFKSLKEALEKRFSGDWVIIVRLHPRISRKSNEFIAYSDWIINGSFIDDIQELLMVTDFLITDYSSIIFDYINTGRPALIYASDIETYKKDRDFHLRLEDTPFIITTNNEQLSNAIIEFDENEYRKKLKEFKIKIGFFDNGKASEYVAKMIHEFIKK